MKDLIKKLLRENIDDTYSSFKHMQPYKQRKQDFINSIKTFNDIKDEDIPKIIDYFGREGFNNDEDAIEDLKEKIDSYKQFPNPVTLYRVIGVKNRKSINTKNLGQHYTPYEWAIDNDMLLSIGTEYWDDDTKPYVIKVLAPLSEIDVWQTIIQNLAFPNEHEINLKNNGKGIKIVDVYELK